MFLELLAVFLISSIMAFFIFMAAIKYSVMTNPNFAYWLFNKMMESLEKSKKNIEDDKPEE